MSDTQTTIAVDNLVVKAGNKRLLGPISFELIAGQTLIVMGETGAGKSLLAQAILGTLPTGLTATGAIYLNGERIDHLSTQERTKFWGHDIAILPQEPWRALDPLMRAQSQVWESHRYVANRSNSAANEATKNDFETLGLKGAEKRMPHALSGGMAQRVAFAAANAAGAPFLIADEPTKGLDAERSDTVINQLTDVLVQGGTLLAITHEVSVARRLGGQLMVLKSGDLVEQGDTEQVLTNPQADYTKQLLAAEPKAWSKRLTAQTGKHLLEAKDVSISRGGQTLIQGFNLSLQAGERVAIVGPSGIGKTSLLDVLAGIYQPTVGQVKRAESMRKTAIQKLYQDPPAAFPARITLGKSLQDVARLHSEQWSVVLEYLSQLGIDESLLARCPDAVSGGELQRISIARALTASPDILLADEPTSRLDPITQRETLSMISEIAAARHVAVILVTHDLVLAEKWADRTIDLSQLSPSALKQVV